MKLPWTKHIEEARAESEQARLELEQTKANWEGVRKTVFELRRERHVNGWTQDIIDIFGSST